MRTIIALFTVVLLFGAASAQFDSILNPICGTMFGQLSPSAPTNDSISVLVTISFAITLAVLSVLGLVYAIGYGLGIDSLKTFVRTEYLESFFNLAMIIFIAGGLGFAGSAISFLSNVAGIGQTTVQVNSVYDAYYAICTNYINTGANTVLGYATEISTEITIIDIFKGTYISAAPGDFGFSGLFFSGLQPIDNIYGLELGFYMAMAGMFVGIPVLLWIVYNLFPWFLYAGVMLRAFPWTRAAGGSFIALFIAFYIVFPAIILPFSQYGVPGNGGITWASQSQISGISGLVGFAPTLITSTLGSVFGGAYLQVEGFGAAASAFAVQILGIVIALLVSLDVVELLGDILGAPSMHAKNLLSKVI